MTTLKNAFENASARTLNDMKAEATPGDGCTDLFFKIGASRGQDIVPLFVKSLNENEDVAIRIALWARDARLGAGERQLFRDILVYLESNRPDIGYRLVQLVPELGRWDDLLVLDGELKTAAFNLIATTLRNDDSAAGLCAKWMPRKGVKAAELRSYMGLTPKAYRKMLVNLTNVVETQMCANDWNEINFSHVPSLASARYRKAFYRHVPDAYAAWADKAVKGEVKVNAGAVYPYDVIKNFSDSYSWSFEVENLTKAERDATVAQWNSLPNYMGEDSILPVVDVSGSMTCVGVGPSLNALHVAVSLGLYTSERNVGPFKDMFVTFSGSPKMQMLKGDVVDRAVQLSDAEWAGNTDLHAVFNLLLKTAKDHDVPQTEMPGKILIISDMQFDRCVKHDDSAIQMIRRKYEEAGYVAPQVVFWNLVAYKNAPVRFDESGTALISGFSPSIMTAVLGEEAMTPEGIMKNAVMIDRYNW